MKTINILNTPSTVNAKTNSNDIQNNEKGFKELILLNNQVKKTEIIPDKVTFPNQAPMINNPYTTSQMFNTKRKLINGHSEYIDDIEPNS